MFGPEFDGFAEFGDAGEPATAETLVGEVRTVRQVLDGTVSQLDVRSFQVADPLHSAVDEHEAIDRATSTSLVAISRRGR